MLSGFDLLQSSRGVVTGDGEYDGKGDSIFNVIDEVSGETTASVSWST